MNKKQDLETKLERKGFDSGFRLLFSHREHSFDTHTHTHIHTHTHTLTHTHIHTLMLTLLDSLR